MKVLVTRAEGAAKATADKLRRRGHEPVLLPLMVYRATGNTLPPGPFSGVVLTSAAALEALAASDQLSGFTELTTYCVGEATAEAARNAGFAKVEAGPGTADDLAEMLASEFANREGRLLYAAGRDRAFDLEGALAARGVGVDTAEVYAAELLDPGREAMVIALDQCAGGAVLLYSARMAAHLRTLVAAHGTKAALDGLTLMAISENVARAASSGHLVRIAAKPDEDAMLDLLDEGETA